MPSRFRSSRKKRGHHTVGYGRVGQHRKHPGGRGKAGGEHHNKLVMDLYHPGFFGKCGMRKFNVHKNRDYSKSINVDRLWNLIPERQRNRLLKKTDGKQAPVIDVTQWGITTVTGRGVLPRHPIVVKARIFTEEAERKIKNAGGAAILRV
eukprot:gnl/Chilomastix_caulleri/168.p1 GENE.gnl/Chilomastix_caulleri/168~~gnl/Chilomastix_caulleri/168.p1  ORF type:complete len:150 (+),score=42.43 gnl/Chilomastix_caulleri/168:43-492(+)